MNISQATNAIIAYEIHPAAVFEAILNQVVLLSTQDNCSNHNIELNIWIYEK